MVISLKTGKIHPKRVREGLSLWKRKRDRKARQRLGCFMRAALWRINLFFFFFTSLLDDGSSDIEHLALIFLTVTLSPQMFSKTQYIITSYWWCSEMWRSESILPTGARRLGEQGGEGERDPRGLRAEVGNSAPDPQSTKLHVLVIHTGLHDCFF